MASSTNLKILFLIEYFAPHIGGVERVAQEVGKRLATKGHHVYIFTTEEEKHTGLLRVYSYHGMTITRIQLPNVAKRYIFALLSLPFLFLLYNDVDIIHSANNYTVAFPAWLFAKLTGKKVTISFWELWGERWFSYLPPPLAVFHWMYESLIRLLPFDASFVPSKYVRNQMENRPVTLAPLGGRALRFSRTRRQELRRRFNISKEFVFLYYGRIGLSKGVDILLSAFQRLVKTHKGACLFLTVPPEQMGQLKDINTHQVHVLPSVGDHDLSSYLSMADAVVIPDRTAAFGLNALEVSHMGRPLVVTTAGALPEVSFGNVVFVDPGSIPSLLGGLKKALQGKWTRIPAKHFSWGKTSRIYDSVFRKLQAV